MIRKPKWRLLPLFLLRRALNRTTRRHQQIRSWFFHTFSMHPPDDVEVFCPHWISTTEIPFNCVISPRCQSLTDKLQRNYLNRARLLGSLRTSATRNYFSPLFNRSTPTVEAENNLKSLSTTRQKLFMKQRGCSRQLNRDVKRADNEGKCRGTLCARKYMHDGLSEQIKGLVKRLTRKDNRGANSWGGKMSFSLFKPTTQLGEAKDANNSGFMHLAQFFFSSLLLWLEFDGKIRRMRRAGAGYLRS